MKIFLITPRFYPEPFTITRIAEDLVKRGHELTVLTGRPHYGKWSIYPGYEKIRYETYNGIKIIRVNEKIRKKGILGLVTNYLSIYFSYKKALKNDNRRTKRECERFFRSEWFDVLTRIDGNMLIDKLRAEVKRI